MTAVVQLQSSTIHVPPVPGVLVEEQPDHQSVAPLKLAAQRLVVRRICRAGQRCRSDLVLSEHPPAAGGNKPPALGEPDVVNNAL